jgi:hypothetical protein
VPDGPAGAETVRTSLDDRATVEPAEVNLATVSHSPDELAIVNRAPGNGRPQRAEVGRGRQGYGRLEVVLVLTAAFMVVLDFSIVNVALASIERELHFAPSSLQWVVTGYAITFGGLLVLGGRAADMYGRRRLFIMGLLVFSIASLAGGWPATQLCWSYRGWCRALARQWWPRPLAPF